MKYARAIIVLGLLAEFFLGSARLAAQDQPQEPSQDPQEQPNPNELPKTPPKPAGRQYPSLGTDENDQQERLTPDNLPLTGVLVPSIGSQEMRHSYFVPGFEYGNFVRSSTFAASTSTDWNTTSYVAGNASMLQQWSRAQLAANFSGGGTFSSDKSQGDGWFTQMNVTQSFNWRHWQVSFIDQFSYLPQSQFGFANSSALSAPGVSGSLAPSLPAVQPVFQPSQSIFSTTGSRYSNSITAEAVYQISPHGSFTMAGSYGILRFNEAGAFNTDDTIANVGYDYKLTDKNTIGVLYRYTTYNFSGQAQHIDDHSFQLAYGRKITGRLSTQLFVGPELSEFRQPFNGSDGRFTVAGGANIIYTLPRINVTASYNHGVTGGSGVFTGADSDQVQGTVSRQLSRLWAGQVSFGYARNSGLGPLNSAISNSVFDSYFVGAGLQRPVNRTANLSLAYTAYIESANQNLCAIGTCSNVVQHEIILSLQWHARPFVLR